MVEDSKCSGVKTKLAPILDVSATFETNLIYSDQSELIIRGTGFHPEGQNKLVFRYNLNFTVINGNGTTIILRLAPGSFWYHKSYLKTPVNSRIKEYLTPNHNAKYPYFNHVLSLMAIDAGYGFKNLTT